MRKIALLALWILPMVPALARPIEPETVAIVYNSALPESRKLAEIYQQARKIPEDNLVGLDLPVTPDISRADYVEKLQNRLRAQFDDRIWWRRQRDANGMTLPVRNDIRVIVLMRGVPLRIQSAPLPEGYKPAPEDPIGARNEASVDSELAMFGVEGTPIEGGLKNVFFESRKSILEAGLPFLVLTARIDSASFATCERMIKDAVETEKTGLWGRAYVDIANKFPEGDQWLKAVASQNRKNGIPTVTDRFDDTLPMNYPMTEASLYYGWYDWSLSGPFLNPGFKFRRGAVAMHLHSFSAEQLVNPAKNWSAGLLEKGAAVTIGNVFEPYLGLTHHFNILHERLLENFTWVEACWMSMPVASWQGIVLGDPLYRPFMRLDGSGEMAKTDNDFRALRAATLKWPEDSEEKQKQLTAAAERIESGVIAESIGLDLLEDGKAGPAGVWFRNARNHYKTPQDKLRQEFSLIAIDRAGGRKDMAVRALKIAAGEYSAIPESVGLRGWLDILDPPPPPPANPNK